MYISGSNIREREGGSDPTTVDLGLHVPVYYLIVNRLPFIFHAHPQLLTYMFWKQTTLCPAGSPRYFTTTRTPQGFARDWRRGRESLLCNARNVWSKVS